MTAGAATAQPNCCVPVRDLSPSLLSLPLPVSLGGGAARSRGSRREHGNARQLEPNLAWKDTVLVRTGETVDILLDVTNPGLWMAHCHIAEHHESGMMFNLQRSRTDLAKNRTCARG